MEHGILFVGDVLNFIIIIIIIINIIVRDPPCLLFKITKVLDTLLELLRGWEPIVNST